MSSPEEEFINSLKSKFPNYQVSQDPLSKNKISMIVESEQITDIALELRDAFGFTHPKACGAVDYPSENRIQMVYYLMNPEKRAILLLKVNIDRVIPRIVSLTKIWEVLSFHEREAHEMFGIDFPGHSNLVPLLLPPDWRGGYQLRKDFKGEGVE